jgi:hypothetical protein
MREEVKPVKKLPIGVLLLLVALAMMLAQTHFQGYGFASGL